ncbi:MAG: rod shape-determining protein MreC [Bacteroidota bacterium]
MSSLKDLFKRPLAVAIFTILQLVSFLLIINSNEQKGETYYGFVASAAGSVKSFRTNWSKRIFYKSRFDSLLEVHTALLNDLSISYYDGNVVIDTIAPDSLSSRQYWYRSAQVIGNSYSQRNNYLTINKGEGQGIEKRMGVISDNGIVGIVTATTEHYARVASILHSRIKVTAAVSDIQNQLLEGSLEWDFIDPKYVYLEGIPNHYQVPLGAEVLTGASSRTFPAGLHIGTIKETNLPPGSSTLRLKVELANDLVSLKDVFIVENLHKDELAELEGGASNE